MNVVAFIVQTLIVAVLGPVLGTLADTKGFKKPIFSGCVIAGCLACVAMGITGSWMSFLVPCSIFLLY